MNIATEEKTNLPSTLVPAAPGFYALWFEMDGGEWSVGKSAIIAWRIELDGLIFPVSINICSPSTPYILTPEGLVEWPGGQCFKTYNRWLDRMCEEAFT